MLSQISVLHHVSLLKCAIRYCVSKFALNRTIDVLFLFIARSSSSCPPLCWGLIVGFVIVLLLGAGIAAVFLKKKGRWSEYLLLFCTESMRCDNLESERVQCVLKLC